MFPNSRCSPTKFRKAPRLEAWMAKTAQRASNTGSRERTGSKEKIFLCLSFSAHILRSLHLVCCFGRCRFMCSARWSLLAKERSQTAHLKGLAPVCLR